MSENGHAHIFPPGETPLHELSESCPCNPFVSEHGVVEHRPLKRPKLKLIKHKPATVRVKMQDFLNDD